MVIAASLAMVGAGTVCLGGALVSRKRIAIAAAAIMFLAMLDAAYFGLVDPLIWAAGLVFAGLLLGFDLRPRAGHADLQASERSDHTRVDRAAMLASALAYPMSAGLLLWHGGAHGAAHGGAHGGVHVAADIAAGESSVAAAHAHGGGLFLLSPVVLMTVLAAALVVVLLALCVRSSVRKQGIMAVETGAMAVMLLAMLSMLH